MKGIRGLLEKDFRLFFRQGSNLFLMLAFMALFFILTGKTGATFIAMYIPSVMAVYSGNTISYDENEHGYTYLFSLPVNKKIYVREKYMFSFIMTVFGWGIGVICAGIAVFIKPGEVFDLEMLAMELITIFVFQAIAGIVIAIRLRFVGEKGRFALPIAVLIVFASCYIIGFFVRANSGLKESISYMIGETGDFGIAIALIVLSLIVWFASYKYSMLEEAYQNRPAELRRLDDRREKEPNWYRNRTMLGMTMYPKLFAGGLKGVIEHLDYLSEQKITYLHLMPLLKMPHPYNDGGYAVEDFKQVDPEIGTNEELKRLTKELRKRGISLCLDVVMNHTADTHEWAIRAKRGEQEYMDRYQCYETREIPDQFEKTMPQVFPETAPGNFTWCEEMHRHVLTTFYPYQWDLNYHNPKVFNEMIGNILYLANMGVEVFRIDAVPYIWKELGTNCRNLPQVHLIW